MRLFEEYASRRGVPLNGAVHVRKGFVYLKDGSELLAIQWDEVGPHPGLYTFSECVLESSCRTKSSRKVVWDDYESDLIKLASTSGPIVSDPNKVFSLTWEYFIRKHEVLMFGLFPMSRIARTLDSTNPSRLVDCMEVLDEMARLSPAALEFWNSKAFSVIDSYCYWVARL